MSFMGISRTVLIVVAAAGASLQSGCSSHRLREGIWELSFNGQIVQTRMECPIEPREVRLLVEWKDGGDAEVVEIANLEGDLNPMYGDIKVESEKKTSLQIDAQDQWHWRMYGVIRDPENVVGELFIANHKQIEDLTMEGRWGLRWLRDE